MILWYRQPATRYFEALPIGNGNLGAMVYGEAARERIGLYEISCYSGAVNPKANRPGAPEAFQRAREALLARDYERGEREVAGLLGSMENYGTNLPMATLRIEGPDGEPARYRRELDLDAALARTTFTIGGIDVVRTAFASCPDQLLVVRIQADRPLPALRLKLDGAENPGGTRRLAGDLLFDGQARETIHSNGQCGVDFHIRLRVASHDGTLREQDDALEIEGAGDIVLLLAAATTFGEGVPAETVARRLDAAAGKTYDALAAAHLQDHRSLFRRVAIDLGGGSDLPTDERLVAARAGERDPGLAALQYQFGRYCLIASSRAGSILPAHLQGVWNDNEACRIGWTCDMHLDINTQMNYWPAETTGLGECLPPLFRWLETIIVPSGRQSARASYGLPGWVAHTVSNPWGFTAPGRASYWGLHVTGGAWIATHLWEHFLFSRDIGFLRGHAYPMLKESAEFFLAYLAADPVSGHLVSGPTSSPENNFSHAGKTYTNTMGTVCDSVLVRELFSICIEAAGALGTDTGFAAELAAARDRLPPLRVGAHGQLMEWLEELEEASPNHRHTTHLLSVFPFNQIDPERTPELAMAARRTLDRRLNAGEGWEDVAWSRSNLILFAARLRDAEWAEDHVHTLLRNLAEDNLMTYCPPHAGAVNNVHEMDGNTGFTAGVTEMLLQSHGGVLHLLPTLPPSWRKGAVRGLRARGGYQVDIEWAGGRLARAVIVPSPGAAPCRVRYGERTAGLRTDRETRFDGNLEATP